MHDAPSRAEFGCHPPPPGERCRSPAAWSRTSTECRSRHAAPLDADGTNVDSVTEHGYHVARHRAIAECCTALELRCVLDGTLTRVSTSNGRFRGDSNRSWWKGCRSADSHAPAGEEPETATVSDERGAATSALARGVSRLNTMLTRCSRPTPFTDSGILRRLSAMFAAFGGFAPQEPAQQSDVWWRTGRAAGNGVR